MRRVYTVFFHAMIPFLLLRLWCKGVKMPEYRLRVGERFGISKTPLSKVDVWIHAVSLGEVVAVSPLIEALLQQKLRVLVTSMTPTGSQQIRTRFGEQVDHCYVPYDFPWALRRFFQQTQPSVGIIVETELWPNLITQARKANTVLLLANGRISDRAYARYIHLRWFFAPILLQFTQILTQSAVDAERFIALGAPISNVKILGNMKFDLKTSVTNPELYITFTTAWGKHRPILIAASTHEGEEQQLLNCLEQLKAAIPNLLLLIAPRHPQRFNAVYELCKSQEFITARRTAADLIDQSTEIVVLDSLGELLGFYQISDYAFVGGSLVPIGGHNVLEPIAMQVPVLCGPYMQNSRSICDELCAADALRRVQNIQELVDACIALHTNKALRDQQINNALRILEKNQGCIQRYLQTIFNYLGSDAL